MKLTGIRTLQLFSATVAAIFMVSSAMAAPPPGYYDSANGLSGEALKGALHNIIKNHTVVPYSSSSKTDTRDAIEFLDEDPLNPANIQPYYRLTPMTKASFGLAGTNGWNREHTWPQSKGADVSPANSDLHALFAEEASLNSSRNNSVYDDFTVNAAVGTLYNRDGNQWTSSQFFPRAASRGNVARAIFYMATRYPVMTITDSITIGYNEMGRKSVLLKWHAEDPPDAQEILRNDRMAPYQGNRNPFVDNPEYVDLIFAPVTGGDGLAIGSTNRATATVGAGAIGYPVLSVNLQATANEWDLNSLTVGNTGTLGGGAISAVKLYRDMNGNGVVDSGEPLIATGTFTGTSTTLTCSSPSRVGDSSPVSFLLVADLSAAATTGETLQFQVTAVTHSPTGGADTNYAGLTLSSSAATVSGGVTSGDTLNVVISNQAVSTIASGSSNFPLLSLDLSATPGEWDLASVSINKVGGAGAMSDASITALKLYLDADESDTVSDGDSLLASTTFSSAAAILTPGAAYRVTTTPVRLLVVATVSGSLSNGEILQVELPAGGIATSPSGGADNPASFSTVMSVAAVVTDGVEDGDSASVTALNHTPASAPAGNLDVPTIGLEITATSNEWDLGTITVNKTGTAADSAVAAVNLFYDFNGDGVVDPDDVLLASTSFSGGSAQLNASGSLRVTPSPVHVLISVDLAANAVDGATLSLSLPANAVTFSPTGGADQNPSFAGFAGGTTTITNASPANNVKIVMVSTRATAAAGVASAASAEFIVLANHLPTPVSLTGWQLRKYPGSPVVLNLSGTIPAYSHFLIASNSYPSASDIEGSTANLYLGTASVLGGLTDTGPVAIGLFDGSSTKVDGFSWGGNATGDTTEPYLRDDPVLTSAPSGTTSTAANQLIVRKRPGGATTGPYQDTGSNAADLQIISVTAGSKKNPPNGGVLVPVTVSAFSAE